MCTSLARGLVMSGATKSRRTLLSIRTLRHAQRRGLPSCILDTNVAENEIPADMHVELADLIATTLGKDLKAVSVSVRAGTKMCRDGTADPAAVLNVWAVNVFTDKSNPTYARAIYRFLSPKLGIPPKRIMMMFHNTTQGQVGTYMAPELMDSTEPLSKS